MAELLWETATVAAAWVVCWPDAGGSLATGRGRDAAYACRLPCRGWSGWGEDACSVGEDVAVSRVLVEQSARGALGQGGLLPP